MSGKNTYRQLTGSYQLPLFHTPAWLDAATGGQWDAVVLQDKGNVLGAWPFTVSKKLGFGRLGQPHFTPYLGPWLHYPPGQKLTSRLSFEREAVQGLVKLLPAYDALEQRLPLTFQNGLPLVWEGFELTTRYTFVIPAPIEAETAFAAFRDSARREIRKAERGLNITTLGDIVPLVQIKKSIQEEKNPHLLSALTHLDGLYKQSLQHGQGQLLGAINEQGTLCGGAWFVWDDSHVHYLFGVTTPQHQTSGAMSLLLWHGIQLAASKGLAFNFEGSMIPAIARFFSGFGGSPVPYLHILHNRSTLLKMKRLI